jgi:MraZ protein
MYTGNYELKIDDKGRVSVPFLIRDNLPQDVYGKGYYIGPGRIPGTLSLCAERHYRSQRVEMPHSDSLTLSALRWQQWEASQTAFVLPDSQGRILIPDRLLTFSGLPREVVLIGAFDHMEIWSRPAFAEFEQQAWRDISEREAGLRELVQRGLYTTPPGVALARPAATVAASPAPA